MSTQESVKKPSTLSRLPIPATILAARDRVLVAARGLERSGDRKSGGHVHVTRASLDAFGDANERSAMGGDAGELRTAGIEAARKIKRGGKRGPGSHVRLTAESWDRYCAAIIELFRLENALEHAIEAAHQIVHGTLHTPALERAIADTNAQKKAEQARAVDMARGEPVARVVEGTPGTSRFSFVSAEVEGDAGDVKRVLDAAFDALHGGRQS